MTGSFGATSSICQRRISRTGGNTLAVQHAQQAEGLVVGEGPRPSFKTHQYKQYFPLFAYVSLHLNMKTHFALVGALVLLLAIASTINARTGKLKRFSVFYCFPCTPCNFLTVTQTHFSLLFPHADPESGRKLLDDPPGHSGGGGGGGVGGSSGFATSSGSGANMGGGSGSSMSLGAGSTGGSLGGGSLGQGREGSSFGQSVRDQINNVVMRPGTGGSGGGGGGSGGSGSSSSSSSSTGTASNTGTTGTTMGSTLFHSGKLSRTTISWLYVPLGLLRFGDSRLAFRVMFLLRQDHGKALAGQGPCGTQIYYIYYFC